MISDFRGGGGGAKMTQKNRTSFMHDPLHNALKLFLCRRLIEAPIHPYVIVTWFLIKKLPKRILYFSITKPCRNEFETAFFNQDRLLSST